MRQEGIYIVAMLACLAAFGCTSKEAAPAEPKEEPAQAEPGAAEPVAAKDPAAEAQEIFQSRCVTCHGATGKGDGPGSAALDPKPRNYTSAEWQKSVTDEHLKKIIVEGGAAVDLSPLMPPNPDLTDKPQVVDALVAVIRNFGDQK
jgi:mono/diheme cytochrome c family protein